MKRNSLIAIFAAVVALGAPFAAEAQSNISEDFTGSTTQNSWWFFNGACLTASALAGQEPTVSGGVGAGGQIPGCTTIASSYYNEHLVGGQNGVAGGTQTLPDPATKGALRFTNGNLAGNGSPGSSGGLHQNGGIVFATPFPTGQGVSITFKTVTYRGDSGGGGNDGADGMSFFLMDASQLSTASITGTSSGNGNGLGSWGGSLGYTCSNSNPPFNGLIGGYLGLGIDEYGNFLNGSVNTLGESGTSASGDNTASGGGYQPGRIGIRLAGNVAWATLNGAYGSNPNNSAKPYYPTSLATSCHISGGTYSGGYCSGNATDAMVAVQNTCSTGTLWNYSNVSNPTSAGATSLSNSVNTGAPTATPAIAPILDYAAQQSGYTVLSGTQIANESAMSRGAATPIFYQLKISQNGRLSLSYATCPPTSTTGCNAFQSVITNQDITASNGPLPANFLFGFAGSTGGSSNIHEILCFKAAPATSASASAGASEKQSATLETGTQVYFAYYNPSNGWTGRVTASSLGFDSFGNVIVAGSPNWDASCVLTGVSTTGTCSTTGVAGPTPAESPVYSGTAFMSRQILSWNSTGNTGISFEYSSLTAAQQTAINLGDTSGTPSLSSESCAVTPPGAPGAGYWVQDRVNYLRGDRSCEVNSGGMGLFRRRSSVLADITDSSPIWVGAPDAPYPATWADRLVSSDPLPENSGQSYPSWATASNQANRTQVVYVGANDGMLHGFRSGYYNPASAAGCAASPSINCGFTSNDGLELLAYVPGAVISGTSADLIHANTSTPPAANLTNIPIDYANPQYGHNYFVNATPAAGDVFYGSAWHTWLVGGLGAGGSAIYALDVSNPGQTTASGSVAGNFSESNAATLVKGEWTNANIVCANNSNCNKSLGNTFGTPQIRRLHDGRWGVIFGNGYGSTNGDAGIFVGVLDPTSGAVTFYYYSAGHGPNNGIAFTTPVDLDGDHISDYVYAGDLKGNLWRFDLTSSSENSWAVTPGPLFTTATGQPITTAIVAASGAANPGMEQQLMLLFGTGQKIGVTNTTAATYASGQQSLYGVWDWNLSTWNTQSTFSQYAALPASTVGTLGQANLQLQSATLSSNTNSSGTATNVDISTNQTICWYGQSQCSSGNNKFGWYINLPSPQEQIIYNPELVAQAVTVNSIVPASNTPTSCTNNPDTGYTYALSALTGAAFHEVFLPPSQVANPGVNNNNAYTDTHAIALLTDATGSSFIIANASGTQYLVYETNQVEGGNGANGNNIQGGSLGLNLPPNTTGRRLGWVELR